MSKLKMVIVVMSLVIFLGGCTAGGGTAPEAKYGGYIIGGIVLLIGWFFATKTNLSKLASGLLIWRLIILG